MAQVVPCKYSRTWQGELEVKPDGTFTWRATSPRPEGLSLPPDRLTPSGTVSAIANVQKGKVTPEKPDILMRVQMKDSRVYLFLFDTLEARQRGYDLLQPGSSISQQQRTPSPNVSASQREPSPTPPGSSLSTSSRPNSASDSHSRGVLAKTNGPLQLGGGNRELTKEDIVARASLLKKDEALMKLHKDLVDGGHLSEDDFWVGKEAKVQEELFLLRQKQGLAPEALIDPQTGGNILTGPREEIETEMTPEMIDRVFREYPEVRRKYEQTVPHQLSEQQFWTAYLHCKYVLGSKKVFSLKDAKNDSHTRKNKKVLERMEQANSIFGDLDEYRLEHKEALVEEHRKKVKLVDRSVDLSVTLNDVASVSAISGLREGTGGYGLPHRSQTDMETSEAEKVLARNFRARGKPVDKSLGERISNAVRDDPVLTKLNERAAMAIHPLDPSRAQESEDLRRKRLEEDHQDELYLDRDLQASPPLSVVHLTLSSVSLAASDSKETNDNGRAKVHAVVPAPSIDASHALPDPDSVYKGALENEADVKLLRLDPSLKGLPKDILDDYLLALSALDEFLRHFWHSSGDKDMKKRCLINDKVAKIQMNLDVELRAAMRETFSDALPLLMLPLTQIVRVSEFHKRTCKLDH